MRRAPAIALATACVTVIMGCQGPVDRLLADHEQRDRLWDRIAGDPDLAGQVTGRLLAADSTRTLLLDRVMADGQARQALLARVAKDRTLMDGAIDFAVQDTAMRDHVMTLVKGMQMGGGR